MNWFNGFFIRLFSFHLFVLTVLVIFIIVVVARFTNLFENQYIKEFLTEAISVKSFAEIFRELVALAILVFVFENAFHANDKRQEVLLKLSFELEESSNFMKAGFMELSKSKDFGATWYSYFNPTVERVLRTEDIIKKQNFSYLWTSKYNELLDIAKTLHPIKLSTNNGETKNSNTERAYEGFLKKIDEYRLELVDKVVD